MTAKGKAGLVQRKNAFDKAEPANRRGDDVCLSEVKPFAKGTLAGIYRQKDSWTVVEATATTAQLHADFEG